jgi:hypothetical protein
MSPVASRRPARLPVSVVSIAPAYPQPRGSIVTKVAGSVHLCRHALVYVFVGGPQGGSVRGHAVALCARLPRLHEPRRPAPERHATYPQCLGILTITPGAATALTGSGVDSPATAGVADTVASPAHARYAAGMLVLNQAANFDLARALSDRSRRGLPCDRTRRPAANQTKPPETTLATSGLPRPLLVLVIVRGKQI